MSYIWPILEYFRSKYGYVYENPKNLDDFIKWHHDNFSSKLFVEVLLTNSSSFFMALCFQSGEDFVYFSERTWLMKPTKVRTNKIWRGSRFSSHDKDISPHLSPKTPCILYTNRSNVQKHSCSQENSSSIILSKFPIKNNEWMCIPFA